MGHFYLSKNDLVGGGLGADLPCALVRGVAIRNEGLRPRANEIRSLLHVLHLQDREQRAENLLLHERRVGVGADHRRQREVRRNLCLV